MKKHNWLSDNWLIIALMILPFPLIAYGYTLMPEEVPVHFNYKMEPDRYGSRMEGVTALLILAGTTIFTNVLLWLTPLIDPKKNIPSFQKTIRKIQVILSVFMIGLMVIIYLSMMEIHVPMMRYLGVAMSLMFLLLGNYFGKLQPNYFIGIRLPWTLENEENWMKTHRLGGKVWVSASLVMLAVAIFLPLEWMMWLFIPYFLIIVLVPTIYSYRLYREMQNMEQNGPS